MMKAVVDNVSIYKFTRNDSSIENYYVKISSGEKCGWGEYVLNASSSESDIQQLLLMADQFYGKTISECLELQHNNKGNLKPSITQGTELALIDLYGKLVEKNVIDVLHLTTNSEVIQLHQIESSDISRIDSMIEILSNSSKCRAVKIYLSGDVEKDEELVTTIRKKYPEESGLLIAAANYNYTDILNYSMESVGVKLNKLHALGVDIVEDPISVGIDEWTRLASFVSPLSLSMDVAAKDLKYAVDAANKNAATIMKITPGASKSVFGVLESAKKIREAGCALAMSSGNVTGIGCTQWQMIAAGIGCVWVECVQKYPYSKAYHDAILKSGLTTGFGYCTINTDVHGFGIEINEDVLKESADECFSAR